MQAAITTTPAMISGKRSLRLLAGGADTMAFTAAPHQLRYLDPAASFECGLALGEPPASG